MGLTERQSALLEQIAEAFRDVAYPGDEGIAERHFTDCGVPCAECENLRATFAGKRWQDYLERPFELLGYFPPREPKTIIGRDFVPLLKEDAFRFFLPVLLSALIIDQEEADVMIDSMPSQFDPGPRPNVGSNDRKHWEKMYERCKKILASLNDQQRQVIARVLEPFQSQLKIAPTVADAIENLKSGFPIAWKKHTKA